MHIESLFTGRIALISDKDNGENARKKQFLRFYEDCLKICISKLTLHKLYFIMMNLKEAF